MEFRMCYKRAHSGINKQNKTCVYLLYLLTVLPKWCAAPPDEQLKSVMPWSMALAAYRRQSYSEVTGNKVE